MPDPTGHGDETTFDLIYRRAEVYDEVLPSYLFDGVEDTDLVARLLRKQLGRPVPESRCRVLELGCGAGRMTRVLAPHASELHAVDGSAGMLRALRGRLPMVTAMHADIRAALRGFAGAGVQFDLVGSFWSMNYPLLACFEHTTAGGVEPLPDQVAAARTARRVVDDLIDVMAPGGLLVVLFFDADSVEQRFVTRLWERVAPFPGSGRDVTWRVLLDGLREAETSGLGRLTHERRTGSAVSHDVVQARRWFTLGHLNGVAALTDDENVSTQIAEFVDEHRDLNGVVSIPTAVHVVEFRRPVA